MKKKFMIAAIAAITLFSTTAFAQDSKQTPTEKNATECCNKNGQKQCMQMLLFDGIQLTDAQKDKLKAIQSPAKKKAERDRTAKKECKAAARQDRLEYLGSVKAVLTPEQYVQFLENSFVNAPAHKKHARKHDHKKACDRRPADKSPRK